MSDDIVIQEGRPSVITPG